MKQRPRIYYSEEQKSIMWDRWKTDTHYLKATMCILWLIEATAFVFQAFVVRSAHAEILQHPIHSHRSLKWRQTIWK